MKARDLIDQLKAGDTVWVKAIVLDKDDTNDPILIFSRGYELNTWINRDVEISLTEPKDEKVEVTEEQARLLKNCEGKSLFSLIGECSEDEEDLLARARLNGYTVKKEPRWVVKFTMFDAVRYFSKFNGCNDLDYNYVGRKENAHAFTDKAKAEAVATLIDGSVEEV